MPPANSRAASPPSDSPAQPETSPSYLSALRGLENPVSTSILNIASTLTATPEDDVAAENLRFLRTPIDPQEEWRAENAQERLRERLRRTAEQRSEDRERRERLQRVLNRLSRIHEPPSYSDRIPTQNNLYDWSPSNTGEQERESEVVLEMLRQQRSYMHPDSSRHETHSSRVEREGRSRSSYSHRSTNTNQPSQSSESSLRSAAIIQSVRRHPRFSARTREYMQRYFSDRDGNQRESQANDRRDRQSPARTPTSLQPTARDSTSYNNNHWQNWPSERNEMAPLERTRTPDERDYWRSRVDSYRRTYLENPSSVPPAPSPWLEHTIRYLSRLRSSSSYDDSLSCALDAGFVTKEFFGENYDDFLLDLSTLPPIAETSWLRPGAVLSGSQHATAVTATTTTTTSANSTQSPVTTTSFLNYNNRYREDDPMDGSRSYGRESYSQHTRRATDTYSAQTPQQDRWPVKVAIHTVDYDKMSLTATMEAYNVPSQSSNGMHILNASTTTSSSSGSGSGSGSSSGASSRTSSITTYLEGEILDFRTHTFLTESFKSDALNDASYWRMLPPFSAYSDDELVRSLVSRRWLTQHLCNEYVLMRWKERCFVRSGRGGANGGGAVGGAFGARRPWDVERAGTGEDEEEIAEDGCGLTISGFYYVCLRRSDGRVEGLYCDPQSSPYQHLKLNSVGGGVFPVWEFR